MRFLSLRVVIGLIIIVSGVLLIMENFIDIETRSIFSYWPVIPLVVGLNWLFLSFRSTGTGQSGKVSFSWGQFVSAIILITFGVIWLGSNMNLIDGVYRETFWKVLFPTILILAGITLIKGRSGTGGGDRMALMGGIDMGKSAWKLESTNYFAFMGGVDIDLTTAEIEEGETVLDLTAIMGGIDVRIPKGLHVVYEGSAILGGVNFVGHEDGGIITNRKIEHNANTEDKRVVILKCTAILGGIEIKEI